MCHLVRNRPRLLGGVNVARQGVRKQVKDARKVRQRAQKVLALGKIESEFASNQRDNMTTALKAGYDAESSDLIGSHAETRAPALE